MRSFLDIMGIPTNKRSWFEQSFLDMENRVLKRRKRMEKMMDWLSKDDLEMLHKSSGELLESMNEGQLGQFAAFRQFQPFTKHLIQTTKSFIGDMHTSKNFPVEAKNDFITCEKVLNSRI